jgi:hypothetical protein
MLLYNEKINKDFFNVSIDGYDLIAEEVTPNEAYNRRETSRKNIIGGTQTVIRTNYIPRDYTIVTHLVIDPLYPNVYDSILNEWVSKPVEVVSKYMGGKFNAECTIKPTYDESPNYIRLEIQLIEIPDIESLIPDDTLKTPSNESNVKIISTKKKKKTKKKTTKKSNKNNSKNKKKGNNITKTKNN